MKLIIALALFAGLFLPPATAHADSCDTYLAGWQQSYDAWAATQCDDLTLEQYYWMYSKYDYWGIYNKPIDSQPEVTVAWFSGVKDGRWSTREGPWIQLRLANTYGYGEACLQISNPYYQGP